MEFLGEPKNSKAKTFDLCIFFTAIKNLPLLYIIYCMCKLRV